MQNRFLLSENRELNTKLCIFKTFLCSHQNKIFFVKNTERIEAIPNNISASYLEYLIGLLKLKVCESEKILFLV